MTIINEQLAEWRKLADAAFPGPWLINEKHSCIDTAQLGSDGIVYDDYSFASITDEDNEKFIRRDAPFIAAAREAVPALLDEIEQLRADLMTAIEKGWQYFGEHDGTPGCNYCRDYDDRTPHAEDCLYTRYGAK